MQPFSSQELDATYHALANATRRKVLARLAHGELSISELAEPFDMSLAAVSKHIKVLEKAGFVKKRREGPTLYCILNVEPIRGAAALVHYLEQFLPDLEDETHES